MPGQNSSTHSTAPQVDDIFGVSTDEGMFN